MRNDDFYAGEMPSMTRTSPLDLLPRRRGFVGPTFSLSNRLKRVVWKLTWLLAARWTPPPLRRWRILVLRLFGAQVSWQAFVYSNVEVWAPWNLTIEDYGSLGPGVNCYNIAPVCIGQRAVVSQGAYLCTGSHDYRDPEFPLIAKPITVGRRAWVCAGAFVGPGVVVGDGAILAARGAAFANLAPWTISRGNPAVVLHQRPVIDD
jgi:putative colanic acid biosynthesis acetyltransferase WcaF